MFPTLSAHGRTAPLVVDPQDHPSVLRAAQDLGDDFGRVTGTPATLVQGGLPEGQSLVIVVGTRGSCALVDQLEAQGHLPAEGWAGRWEAYRIRLVEAPFPGVSRALVIAGSDPRGTIFGIYEVSSRIGVSPWHWWADVPSQKSVTVEWDPALDLCSAPAVKWRGIFLNDEYPALTKWVGATYGPAPVGSDPPVPEGVANYGAAFHAKVFELLLRLKANTFWPAMWNNAFHEDDPDNGPLAARYGIVLGTSHQEPMGRAQKEWDRRYAKTLGYWNYGKHSGVLEEFWKEGLEQRRSVEQLVTIGLRGADDTEMAPGGPQANLRLLENIVERQRNLLSTTLGKPADQIPQVWCLYKEVTDYYNAGMRVPDDVLLLWGEDNWGNLRRVPTAAERTRKGGAGIYYHFDYHGGPRSYQWTNTSPIAKVWDQMSLARQYGADRLWVVNVGHFKGYEHPLSFFLDFAWDPSRWNAGNLGEFTRTWARSLFGADLAEVTAGLVEDCARFHGRRKPELLAPDTYSLVDHGEAERVVAQWRDLEARALAVWPSVPSASRDAFVQLVLHPIRTGACVADLYVTAGLQILYAAQGRASALRMQERVAELFAQFQGFMADYGTLAGGKWNHFQDQPVLGYVAWNDPPKNHLDHLKLVPVTPSPGVLAGVAVDGSAEPWSGAPLVLPQLDPLGRPTSWVEVFRRGTGAFRFEAQAREPWLKLDSVSGQVDDQVRIIVSVNWDLVPPGLSQGTLAVTAPGLEALVTVPVHRVAVPAGLALGTFLETDRYLSIRADHFAAHRPAGSRFWEVVTGYGPEAVGMRATAETDAPALVPGTDAPCLEYRVAVVHPGRAEVRLHLSPVLNFQAGRPVRVAVSLDRGQADLLTLVPAGFIAGHENPDWCQVVADEDRVVTTVVDIPRAGSHTLEVWMVDPGPVLTRLEVDLGGLRPTRLGPPESPRT